MEPTFCYGCDCKSHPSVGKCVILERSEGSAFLFDPKEQQILHCVQDDRCCIAVFELMLDNIKRNHIN